LDFFVFTSPRLELRDTVSVTHPDKNVRNAAANRQVDNNFMKVLLGNFSILGLAQNNCDW
jgi:hypothetical protein